MSARPQLDRQQLAHTALRVVSGLAFFTHGAQKLFGWFGGGDPVALMSRFGVAGLIEVGAGLLIAAGLRTRAAALLASGEMAVAYAWMHALRTGDLFWWQNGGELPMLFAFIFLLLAVDGPGAISVDGVLAKRSAPSADAG